MKIEFYLRFNTQFGESLWLTGNMNGEGAEGKPSTIAMRFLNREYWHATIEVDLDIIPTLAYRYILSTVEGEMIVEGERNRSLDLAKESKKNVVLIDTWNEPGAYENAFYSAPFTDVLFSRKKAPKVKSPKKYSHLFKVKFPLLQPDECPCIVGSSSELNEWKTTEMLLLEKKGDWWIIALDIPPESFPLSYKYGIYDFTEDRFVRYENGDNRALYRDPGPDTLVVVHDGFVRLPNHTWRAAGVAVPVFSLRSNNSFGVGEFNDIRLLVDWAEATGLKLIQLLPVNDTSATFSWQDSYPYAAISAFALHPVYINLAKTAGKKGAVIVKSLSKKQRQLNGLPEVDYEAVMKFKMQILRELYELDGGDFLKEKAFRNFYEENSHWLRDYAAFCLLRDKYRTSDFNQWKTHSKYVPEEVERLSSPKTKSGAEIHFHYFIQYHLHLQLKEASEYAHKKGIVLKGDIPIGIYRFGADAWTAPELYHLCWQAGAPPDDFAVKGQNWGFPTYNWKRMQEDGFRWWRDRFHQMRNYFDAFRIDHILGFFRIWSIPLNAVEGILGRFVPALPVSVSEFGERGIWFDYDRFCTPFINDAVLQEIFGDQASFVRSSFLQPLDNGTYQLKEAFSTQRKIESFFAGQDETEEAAQLKTGLYDLVSNVLLYEEPDTDRQAFHFRISIEHTTSYKYLDDRTKSRLYDLYIHYFYHRHDAFWKKEALRKLPYLKEATEMLVCGEDLGMVPHCVPEVMHQLGILSLEIQRMPKNPQTTFFHPKDAPYLSVITPSTHDMSTLRAWWEEDGERTRQFFHTVMGEGGEVPYFCEPWVNRAIVLQHLYSPAMWSIFQLQDLLGMSETLRRPVPQEERINDPSNPKHYWRYRMHITLEQLNREKEFNRELMDYIENSGRNR